MRVKRLLITCPCEVCGHGVVEVFIRTYNDRDVCVHCIRDINEEGDRIEKATLRSPEYYPFST